MHSQHVDFFDMRPDFDIARTFGSEPYCVADNIARAELILKELCAIGNERAALFLSVEILNLAQDTHDALTAPNQAAA